MDSSLEIVMIEQNDQVTYKLSGQIDEDADLDKMLSGAAQSRIVFDLADVTMINSCGIRDWIEFQKKINQETKIIYENCPQVIIEQMNIIKGFIREGGEISSFYAPYYNPATDEEIKILLTPEEVIEGKAPEKKDEQGRMLEFDEIELQYFNFLKK
ncbi:MAG: hypothetical protein CME62_00640 [Halobacteriovoraceae bacterium]|nr:hypothetical protein [Halobacteriovoraceae bacterium]